MRFTRKTLALVAAPVATLALAGSAFAYWTAAGSGSATASVAGQNGTITLEATVGGAPLVPGESRAVSFTATNSGTTNLFVDTISLAGVTVDGAHGGCAVADFSMLAVNVDTLVPGGATDQALPGSGNLVFANSASNQDACKGATITLSLASN